jgi:hypothetical protein
MVPSHFLRWNKAMADSPQAGPPETVQWTDDFEEIRRAEVAKIDTRRATIDPPDPCAPGEDGLPVDLVGIALSGGGIRAASVGLGALQALHASPHWKEFDYLSTVSGGGYIGGYLTAAAIASPTSMVPQALAVKGADPKADGFGQPSLVQRFIYGGKYLLRPWEAANKYLMGLFLNNLLVFSGLVAFGALISLIWRSFDFEAVRDFLELFRLNSGITAAFFLFGACMLPWLVAWLFSRKHKLETIPNKYAQRALYCMAASFAIGIAVLVVNVETKLGFLDAFFGQHKVEGTGAIGKWLLGLLAAGLAPLLAPKQLLQFGLHPKNLWQRAVFHVAMFALLIGIPLLVIAMLAKPNISGTVYDRDNNLRAGDIMNWPAFMALMGDKPCANEGAARYDLRLRVNALRSEINQFEDKLLCDHGDRRLPAVVYFEKWWRPIRQPDKSWEFWWRKRALDADKEAVCTLLNNQILTSIGFPLAALQEKLLLETETITVDATLPVAAAAVADGNKQAPNPAEPKTTGEMIARVKDVLKARQKEQLSDADLDGDLYDARLSYRDSLPPKEIRGFNLTILRALHPECFYEEGKAYRQLVIVGDQITRLRTFGVSSLLFIFWAIVINLNGTSLHRFYRNRIKHAYLTLPVNKKDEAKPLESKDTEMEAPDVDLSKLNTTDKGAPYHLINATIDLSRPRLLDQIDEECADPKADRRDVQTFIFSQLYCGAQATGWRPTSHYENFRRDNINFADAIALSGSASDPFRAGALGLTAAMTALNLTLGQWMPNPRYQKPWFRPNFLGLWWDWKWNKPEESTYCYVSDGGFTDNLGIMSLLRRRCRLIVAVDASCDRDRAFVDLNWLIRMARMSDGIKILEPRKSDKDADEVLNTSCLDLDEKGRCERHFVLARIIYPESDAKPAWLVYLKPSFTGDEGADLLKYQLESPGFPNDDTSDQFYEPARVESYRQLGFHITADFCGKVKKHASKKLIDGVAALGTELATAQAKADEDLKTKHELPNAVPKALSIAGKVTSIFEDSALRSRQQDSKRDHQLAQALEEVHFLRQELQSLLQSFKASSPSGISGAASRRTTPETTEQEIQRMLDLLEYAIKKEEANDKRRSDLEHVRDAVAGLLFTNESCESPFGDTAAERPDGELTNGDAGTSSPK